MSLVARAQRGVSSVPTEGYHSLRAVTWGGTFALGFCMLTLIGIESYAMAEFGKNVHKTRTRRKEMADTRDSVHAVANALSPLAVTGTPVPTVQTNSNGWCATLQLVAPSPSVPAPVMVVDNHTGKVLWNGYSQFPTPENGAPLPTINGLNPLRTKLAQTTLVDQASFFTTSHASSANLASRVSVTWYAVPVPLSDVVVAGYHDGL